MNDLQLQRAQLVGRSYSEAFPGTRAWKAARAAEEQLAKFDLDHPEVLEQINAKRAAATAPGVERALRGED